MSKTIALLLLVTLCAPLFAGGRMEGVFEKKIADDWYRHFQSWVEDQCNAGQYPETFFADSAGVTHPYRVRAVKETRLVCIELLGELREPATTSTTFQWEDWKPRFVAGTYPVKTNEDSQDVIAFAAWLYLNSEDPFLANRVLTVVYERDEAMREAIAEYVIRRHGLSEKDKLAVGEIWDSEFQKWRRVLLKKSDADERESKREADAKQTVNALLTEYADPETRTKTLAQLEFELKEWQIKYEETDAFKRSNPKVLKTLESIKLDHKKIDTLVQLAAGEVESNLQAEGYEKALALDPQSGLLLSKAANSWMEHGNPEFLKNAWVCTHESSIRKAKALYYRWLERDPDNKPIMDQLVICHEVFRETNDADKMRRRIKELAK